jgi:hypothetical protein
MAALRLAAVKLSRRAAGLGGTLIVIGSPRTPADAWTAIRETAAGNAVLANSSIRYPVLLADADEQFVTADSVSMISEAVMSGKPVGLIPVEADARGQRRLIGRDPATTQVRDPRRFWRDIEARGLVGTVDAPKRGDFEDPVKMAVAAVRERLGCLFD